LTHKAHNPEDEGGRFLRNYGNPLPTQTAQHHRRTVSSTTIRLKKSQHFLQKSEALNRFYSRLSTSQMIYMFVRVKYRTRFCKGRFDLFASNSEKIHREYMKG
jgi:hypothetical protein